MAGSLHHLLGSDDHGWSMIENMGDAYECVEEMLFLLLALTGEEDREDSLINFRKLKNLYGGTFSVKELQAYERTSQVMER